MNHSRYKILLLGAGGREHALAWKLSQSPLLEKLYVAPGNAGTSEVAENVKISVTDFEQIGFFVLLKQINMVVVGPEEPLVKGIRDYFLENPALAHIPVIGPDKTGAMLEGSKDFAKEFMFRHQIPTAAYQTFTSATLTEGIGFLKKQSLPVVLKADGLAAGKGVIICQSYEEAEENLKTMLAGQFGDASSKVVIESFLSGIEVSVFVLTDGNSYVLLPEAKDYKRIGEGDTGLNTGGMGAVSPVSFADKTFLDKVETRIIKPTIDGLKKENIDYQGFIFFGLINVNGDPFVIEYNCRMGDPETEAVMVRLENDLADLFLAVANRKLHEKQVKISQQTAATIMLVSGGYPQDYEKGKQITGFEAAKDVQIFHAGTTLNAEKHVVTNGGRVIAITGTGDNLQEALEKANLASQTIAFEKKYYRKDIGFDLLK
jgi:phosphoribosylamine--glycine ligase